MSASFDDLCSRYLQLVAAKQRASPAGHVSHNEVCAALRLDKHFEGGQVRDHLVKQGKLTAHAQYTTRCKWLGVQHSLEDFHVSCVDSRAAGR